MEIILSLYRFNNHIGGKFENDCAWNEVADSLNGLGECRKTGAMWKKYWNDLSRRVKTKYSRLKEEIERTGRNGETPLEELDETENKIMTIITLDAVEGLSI